MNDFKSLQILDRFQSLFQKADIDYPAMRKILQLKLTMDRRRVPTAFQQNKKKEQDDSNQFIKLLWFYALLGLFLIPFMLIGEYFLFQMSIVYGISMFIIMTTMISDFSSVLLDIRDRNILHTKPVSSKTIGAAKVIHVFIYMLFLTAAIMLVPLIVSVFAKGPLFALIFLVNIIFIDLLIVVMTAVLYILILKFFDGERLKDIINYVQIGLSISILIGYQVLIRSFEFVDFNIVFQMEWWHFIIPPIWYGATFEVLLNGNIDPILIALSLMGILIPPISIILYSKLTPVFERNLQKLSEQGGSDGNRKNIFQSKLSAIVCRTKQERAFYNFASIMMKNERQFKLKVYPTLGFSLVIPFLFMFNILRDLSLEELASTNYHLSIYFSLMMIPTVISSLKFSGAYKGSWIYGVTPIREKSAIYKGTLKAFLYRLFLPIYLLLSVVFVIMFGTHILVDLFIVFVSASIYIVICFKASFKSVLPFSASFNAVSESDGYKVFILMGIILIFSAVHYYVITMEYHVYFYLILILIIQLIVWRKILK